MREKRIYLTGVGGIGKSFFARELSKKIGIKNYELDDVVFKNNQFERVNEKVRNKKLNKILKNKKWIIDGAYTKIWIEPIIKKCDIIILIKTNYFSAKAKIFLRFFKGKILGNRRKENLKEIINLARLSNKKSHLNIEKTMRKLSKKYNKKLIIVRSKKEIEKILVKQNEK